MVGGVSFKVVGAESWILSGDRGKMVEVMGVRVWVIEGPLITVSGEGRLDTRER